jgi:hypothetical protein
MLIVFAGHSIFLMSASTPPLVVRASDLAVNVCVPMFMCISGMTMWYLLMHHPGEPRRTAYRYAKRALLLLAGCHIMITLGTWPLYWDKHSLLEVFWRRWHITDAIAFCMFLAPVLIMKLDDTKRLLLAVALLLGSRTIASFWHPEATALGFVKELLFGSNDYDSTPVLLNIYPMVPFLATFLLGTVLLPALLRRLEEGGPKSAIMFLYRTSSVLLALGGIGVLAYLGLHKLLDHQRHADILAFFYPSRVWTLLPLQCAVGALFLIFIIWRYLSRKQYSRLDFVLTVFGRTSLFAYVAQYFVIQAIPAAAGCAGAVPMLIWAPLVVLLAAVMFLVSFAYARFRGYVAEGEYRAVQASVSGPPVSCQVLERAANG